MYFINFGAFQLRGFSTEEHPEEFSEWSSYVLFEKNLTTAFAKGLIQHRVTSNKITIFLFFIYWSLAGYSGATFHFMV